MNIHTNYASLAASIILSYVKEDPKDYIYYFKTIFSEETLKGIGNSDKIRTICAEQITDYCLDNRIYFHFDILTDLFLKCIRGSEFYFLNQRANLDSSIYLYRYPLKSTLNAFFAKYQELTTDNFKKFVFNTCGANIVTVSSCGKKLSELDCVLLCDAHDNPSYRAINSIAALLFSNIKPCVIYTERNHQTIYRMIDTMLLDCDVRIDCWDQYYVPMTDLKRSYFFIKEALLYGCELISYLHNQFFFTQNRIRFTEFLARYKFFFTQFGTLSQNVLRRIDDWEYYIKKESTPDAGFIQTHLDILISSFQFSDVLAKAITNETFRKRQIFLTQKLAKHATTYPGTLPIFLMGKFHAITEESTFEPILGQYLEKHGVRALAISYEINLSAAIQEIANEVPHSYHNYSTGYEIAQTQDALNSYASLLYSYCPTWHCMFIEEINLNNYTN